MCLNFQHHIWRKPGTAHHLLNITQWVLATWACFSAPGTERLLRAEEKLNGGYLNLKKKEKKLIRCTKELSWLSRRFTLQEDNDDKHTAQITCPWVAQLENWPQPNQTLSRETWKRVIYWEPPSNLTGLESICREEQQNIVKSRCANFMTSYSRRLEAICADKNNSKRCRMKNCATLNWPHRCECECKYLSVSTCSTCDELAPCVYCTTQLPHNTTLGYSRKKWTDGWMAGCTHIFLVI